LRDDKVIHQAIETIKKNGALGVLYARSLVMFAQGLPLFAQKRLVRELAGFKSADAKKIRLIGLERLTKLYAEDAKKFSEGVFPIELLSPELGPVQFTKSWFSVIWDGIGLSLREANKNRTYFDDEAKKHLKDLPEYYQRNFHFQTNGYLSTDSAKLYDHQVDLLFLGSTDAMRRQIVPLIKTHVKNATVKGLEIGVGTGSSTKAVLYSLPNAKIIGIDPSKPYLDYAAQRLVKFNNLSLKKGLGEDLKFNDNTFDFVYSVYVFHEVPMEIRKKIVSEAFRVLKPGGVFVFADSIQKKDDPELDWILDFFPQNFHEPFYKNYIENNVDKLFPESQWTKREETIGFTTKAVCYQKS
jgi:ubiquinone/menaquinone biosynthesis C-methylase UbiE